MAKNMMSRLAGMPKRDGEVRRYLGGLGYTRLVKMRDHRIWIFYRVRHLVMCNPCVVEI